MSDLCAKQGDGKHTTPASMRRSLPTSPTRFPTAEWSIRPPLDSPAVHGLNPSLDRGVFGSVRQLAIPSRPRAGFRGRPPLPSPCAGPYSHSDSPAVHGLPTSLVPRPRGVVRCPRNPLSTVGRFPRSSAAPFGRDVTASGRLASLDPRVRTFLPGPILGHQCVA